MADNLDFTVTIATRRVPCRVPFLPTCARLVRAWNEAGGEADDTRAFLHPDPDALDCVNAAALGICCQVDLGLPPHPTFATLAEFGSAVIRRLVMVAGYSYEEVIEAGGTCRDQCVDMLVSDEEVEQAADPFEGLGETSTGCTS